MFKSFEDSLRERKLQGLLRHLKSPQTGPERPDFESNDYLGLSGHPKIRARMAEALAGGIPLSAKSSRLLSGNSLWHEETESLLSGFLSREGVLSFSSGYLANIGALPALIAGGGRRGGGKKKAVFSDRLNHASLIDGIRLSGGRCQVFPHRDLNALEDLLKKTRGEKIIVTESLFSMTGGLAPLREISDLALRHHALLYVDEAHATGLFGPGFAGFAAGLSEKEHIISLHTAGKALGSSGAFIGCQRLIRDFLINCCRSFIYTTAPPPLLMVQWKAAIEVLKEEPFRPLELRKQSLSFRLWLSKALKAAFPAGLEPTESPVIFLPAGGPAEALKKEKLLMDRGLNVRAIRCPAVPKGGDGLRIVLKCRPAEKDLSRLKGPLLEAFAQPRS